MLKDTELTRTNLKEIYHGERELRRMNRMELIEIIYALKQHEEELERQNAKLCRRLADRTLRLERLVLAEAALSLKR